MQRIVYKGKIVRVSDSSARILVSKGRAVYAGDATTEETMQASPAQTYETKDTKPETEDDGAQKPAGAVEDEKPVTPPVAPKKPQGGKQTGKGSQSYKTREMKAEK